MARPGFRYKLVYILPHYFHQSMIYCSLIPIIPKVGNKIIKGQFCFCESERNATYAERMDSYLNSLMNGEPVDRAPETFLLIEDLDEVLESVSEIRLVPCNCSQELVDRTSETPTPRP